MVIPDDYIIEKDCRELFNEIPKYIEENKGEVLLIKLKLIKENEFVGYFNNKNEFVKLKDEA